MMHIRTTNWRIFNEATWDIPDNSVYILDKNGSGKTSLLSALYTLWTAQPFPGTRLRDALKNGADYFGIQDIEQGDFISGVLRPTGRLQLKTSDDFVANTRVYTYIPNDNLWFSLSRTRQLEIWNTLLFQRFGALYASLLFTLEKSVATKSRLIKSVRDSTAIVDIALIKSVHDTIVRASEALWRYRKEYFEYVIGILSDFQVWIDSDVTKLQLEWWKTNSAGVRTRDIQAAVDWEMLWHKEVRAGKVLYGAQRDEILVKNGDALVFSQFSRGELRALVIFFKKVTRDMTEGPVLWLLDDVFNEFDTRREQTILAELIHDEDRVIATGTKPLPDGLKNIVSVSLEELKIPV